MIKPDKIFKMSKLTDSNKATNTTTNLNLTKGLSTTEIHFIIQTNSNLTKRGVNRNKNIDISMKMSKVKKPNIEILTSMAEMVKAEDHLKVD